MSVWKQPVIDARCSSFPFFSLYLSTNLHSVCVHADPETKQLSTFAQKQLSNKVQIGSPLSLLSNKYTHIRLEIVIKKEDEKRKQVATEKGNKRTEEGILTTFEIKGPDQL